MLQQKKNMIYQIKWHVTENKQIETNCRHYLIFARIKKQYNQIIIEIFLTYPEAEHIKTGSVHQLWHLIMLRIIFSNLKEKESCITHSSISSPEIHWTLVLFLKSATEYIVIYMIVINP